MATDMIQVELLVASGLVDWDPDFAGEDIYADRPHTSYKGPFKIIAVGEDDGRHIFSIQLPDGTVPPGDKPGAAARFPAEWFVPADLHSSRRDEPTPGDCVDWLRPYVAAVSTPSDS